MPRRYILLVLLFSFSCHCASSQEFWMMPDAFTLDRGDTLTMRFKVGDSFVGETWNLREERIQSVKGYVASGQEDLTTKVIPGRGDHLKFPLNIEGSYVIAMSGKNAFVELPADRFNTYLKEYSLDDAINQRKKNGTTDRPGKEFYVRYAKLILQVGEKLDDGYKKKTGLPFEIIPEKNPATYRKGDMVKFVILFQGKPVFGARAFVWNNNNNRTYSQPIYSQQDGTIDVRLFNDGAWMISVVKMVPSKEQGADWQSYWGTVVFNVRE